MTDLIIRAHQKGDAASTAVYSPCELYRYALTRVWDAQAPRMVYIMLNPSKATELANDPTVERCERRARALGYGAFRVCNLFAFRATDPKDLKAAAEPFGPANAAQLMAASAWGDMILCGWGTHGAHFDQGRKVADGLRQTGQVLHHLGLSKEGHPRHPLYISYTVTPQVWV